VVDLPSPAATEPATPTEDDGLADYFDPNLKSQSTVYLEERGARIRDVRVTTLDGKPVNVLRMGKKYLIQFAVAFSEPFDAVDFGATFRSTSGLAIAGCMTNHVRGYHIPDVVPGDFVIVEIETGNPLLPGKYFINVGVFARRSGEELVAHRITDALMVSVALEWNLIATGLIDSGMSVRSRLVKEK
jgi:lipopolysaccharide transport system ATP-binding protein